MKKKLRGLTREQAEDILAESTIEVLGKYCPLSKETCRRDCASFKMGSVLDYAHTTTSSAHSYWRVSLTKCSNMIVQGAPIERSGNGKSDE